MNIVLSYTIELLLVAIFILIRSIGTLYSFCIPIENFILLNRCDFMKNILNNYIVLGVSILISDFLINFLYFGKIILLYDGCYWQYASYVLIALLGKIFSTYRNKFILLFVAPVLFFIITNFGVWIQWNLYPHTITGLVTCYLSAIPFFRDHIILNFIYGSILLSFCTEIENLQFKNTFPIISCYFKN